MNTATPAGQPSSLAAHLPLRKKRVLIIEDHEDTLSLLVMLLEQYGYDVIAATRASEGRAILADGGVDLVLLDRILPDQDGLAFCQEARQAPSSERIPIVFVSSCARGLDVDLALKVGGTDYVVKPFHPGELVAKVNFLLASA